MEDYRNAIQKLKVQIAQLEKENNETKIKLNIPVTEELRVPQFENILNKYNSNLYVRERVLQELKKCCDERGMTIEMLFRCADKSFINQVTVEDFKEFLDQFFQRRIDTQVLLKVALLFDDDCSGIIMKDEFYRVLVYCKVDGENHSYLLGQKAMKIGQANEDPAKLQLNIMDKFIKYIRELKNTAQGIAYQIDYQQKGYITLDDLIVGLQNKGFGQNEIFIIMKYFDISGNNKVKLNDFIYDLKDCLNGNKTVEQLVAYRKNNTGLKVLQELRQFRNILQKYKVDPLMIFYQCQPKDVLKKQITDLAITFSKYLRGVPFEQILGWLQFMDVSRDGAVDLEEFKMVILVEEDLATFQQFKQESKEQIDPSLIEIVIDKMKRKQVTLEQFFDWMDSDHSQSVTVAELKKGFIALNIELSYVIKLLKLFDKNQSGVVEISEFYEAFGPEYQVETDRIIMRKLAQKLNNLFIKNKIDFVQGMKQLLYTYNSECPIITIEEFLMAMDNIKNKCRLTDSEIMKVIEYTSQKQKDQIELNSLCNYLYQLL